MENIQNFNNFDLDNFKWPRRLALGDMDYKTW